MYGATPSSVICSTALSQETVITSLMEVTVNVCSLTSPFLTSTVEGVISPFWDVNVTVYVFWGITPPVNSSTLPDEVLTWLKSIVSLIWLFSLKSESSQATFMITHLSTLALGCSLVPHQLLSAVRDEVPAIKFSATLLAIAQYSTSVLPLWAYINPFPALESWLLVITHCSMLMSELSLDAQIKTSPPFAPFVEVLITLSNMAVLTRVNLALDSIKQYIGP